MKSGYSVEYKVKNNMHYADVFLDEQKIVTLKNKDKVFLEEEVKNFIDNHDTWGEDPSGMQFILPVVMLCGMALFTSLVLLMLVRILHLSH